MVLKAKADESTASRMVTRYVAVCDVLGFSWLVQNTPLEDVRDCYREIIKNAIGASALTSKTTWPDGRTEMHVTDLVGTAVFSDSIIVWSRPLDSGLPEPYPGERAATFFLFIGKLILFSLRKTRCGLRFPIRAGIAYGAVAILPEEQVYVGRPIVYAHQMEQAQQWVGAACHPSCFEAPDFEIVGNKGKYRYVTEYPVPLDERRKAVVLNPDRPDLLPVAVAWPGMIWTLPQGPEDYYMKNIEDLVHTAKLESNLEPRDLKKWENTLSFGMQYREFRDPDDKELL
jgi:hypothetical protein